MKYLLFLFLFIGSTTSYCQSKFESFWGIPFGLDRGKTLVAAQKRMATAYDYPPSGIIIPVTEFAGFSGTVLLGVRNGRYCSGTFLLEASERAPTEQAYADLKINLINKYGRPKTTSDVQFKSTWKLQDKLGRAIDVVLVIENDRLALTFTNEAICNSRTDY